MMNDNNQSEKIIKNLQEDWNQLEKLSTSKEPSAFFMKDNLQYYQSRKKKAFYRELKLFIITAIFLLSCLSILAFQTLYIIAIIEVASIIVAPIIYFMLTRKQEGKIFDDRN
ncbi:YxlC family protein [Niallia sp. RD1]|uniref:YxlC family protein n=1 Tax=Niallia sp. RD1 TaxID=2962858 RepID=UPI0020C1A26D|nr:YxlC family protein [Niallia sp. RD1]UTI43801.1 YxlC family protein [Niallia sp. RD1]